MDSSFDRLRGAGLHDGGIVFDDTYVTVQINSYNQRVLTRPEFARFS